MTVDEDIILRSLISFSLAVFTTNLVYGSYIFFRMILPQQINFRMLKTFYYAALLTSLFQIALVSYLLINPQDIHSCYTYQKSVASILHSLVCSGVIACGFITITTMHQIKTSLQVMLDQLDEQRAQRQQRNFIFTVVTIWIANQLICVSLLIFFSDKTMYEISMQAIGMGTITILYAYQLFSLTQVMRLFEISNRQDNSQETTSFKNERRSIKLQFIAFVVGFSLKFCFNVYLLVQDDFEGRLFGTEVVWCILLVIWTALPISYSFYLNFKTFKRGIETHRKSLESQMLPEQDLSAPEEISSTQETIVERRKGYESVFCEIMSPLGSQTDDKFALNPDQSNDTSDVYPSITIKTGIPSSVNNDMRDDDSQDDEVNFGSRASCGTETEMFYRREETEKERLTMGEQAEAHAVDSSLYLTTQKNPRVVESMENFKLMKRSSLQIDQTWQGQQLGFHYRQRSQDQTRSSGKQGGKPGGDGDTIP